MLDEEFLGDPSRVRAARQAAELWKLLKSNGQYRYYGRAIGLNGPTEDTAQQMGALARIQGVGICYYCPKEDGARLFPELESSGLSGIEIIRGVAFNGFKLGTNLIAQRFKPGASAGFFILNQHQ